MRPPLRSILFVPGDSERKIGKSRESRADAVVFDLEDSVAQDRKPVARAIIAEHLRGMTPGSGTQAWVRINPLDTPGALDDLSAVTVGQPAGILLPKVRGPAELERLSHFLDILEVRDGIPPGAIRIMPVATEVAQAAFSFGAYAPAGLSRLYGITWGAEDLSADLGAAGNTDEDGRLSLTYRMVRSNTLLAAKACGVEAVDTVFPDFRDEAGLRRTCLAARREGFSGCFAIHPGQVDVINEAFSPNVADVAFAERVVAAFAAEPSLGVVGMDGRMLDKPHLTQAQKVLAMRDAFARTGS